MRYFRFVGNAVHSGGRGREEGEGRGTYEASADINSVLGASMGLCRAMADLMSENDLQVKMGKREGIVDGRSARMQ